MDVSMSKNFQMTVRFFKAYEIMLNFTFSHFSPQVRQSFLVKRKAKIFASRNTMESSIRKILTFVKR